jgi:hypothetical protein
MPTLFAVAFGDPAAYGERTAAAAADTARSRDTHDTVPIGSGKED